MVLHAMKFTSFLILLVFSAQAHAQDIAWSVSNPLSVQDFKGKPDASVPYFAMTYSRIGQKMALENGVLRIEVTHFFDPVRSWMRKEKADSALLQHEQLHFTLSEVYARRVQQKLKTITPVKNLQAAIRSVVEEELRTMNEQQDAYDRETKHGTNTAEQLRWSQKIAEMMRQTPDSLLPFDLVGF